VSSTHYCVVGDVTVDDTAVIAPGVVLQASPGSRIVVAPGACLAGGVCIQSRQGVLTVGAGATSGQMCWLLAVVTSAKMPALVPLVHY